MPFPQPGSYVFGKFREVRSDQVKPLPFPSDLPLVIFSFAQSDVRLGPSWDPAQGALSGGYIEFGHSEVYLHSVQLLSHVGRLLLAKFHRLIGGRAKTQMRIRLALRPMMSTLHHAAFCMLGGPLMALDILN